MSTKLAINGLGRIGRAILKLLIDEPSFEVVALNDLVEADNLAYLLRFDTVYGRYAKPVVGPWRQPRCRGPRDTLVHASCSFLLHRKATLR